MTVNASYYAGGSGYTPADMLQRDADWVSPGVLSSSDLIVAQTATASMNVTVSGAAQGQAGGNAWLPNGYRVYNDTQATLTISAADTTNPRWDLVCIGIDTTTNPYTPQLKVITGTAAASPTVPSMPTGFVGIALANVYVGANVTSITSNNIIDVRDNAGLNTSNATLTPSITYGMNSKITNNGNVSVSPKFTIQGKTVINLLGKDGNCEDVSKWQTNGTLSLDSTNKVFGNNGFKLTLNSTANNFANPISKYNIDITKYYLISVYLKNGNATNVRLYKDAYGGGIQINSSYVTDATKYTRVGIIVQPSDFNASNYIVINATGASANYIYTDGIMINEITSAEYALGVDALLAKYPYVDSYACLQNPYMEIRHDNLWRNGNCEESIAWYTSSNSNVTFSIVNGKFQLVTNSSGGGSQLQKINVKANTDLYLSGNTSGSTTLTIYASDGTTVLKSGIGTFNTGNNTIIYGAITNASASQTGTADSIMLIEGTTAPPQYLSCRLERVVLETKLTSDDSVTYNNGEVTGLINWKHRTLYGKDYDWQFSNDYTGNKSIQVNNFAPSANFIPFSEKVVKYDGKLLVHSDVFTGVSDQSCINASNGLFLDIADIDTGWAESINPNNDEVKAGMNGWKAVTNISGRYNLFISMIDNSFPSCAITSSITATSNTTSVTVSDGTKFAVGQAVYVIRNGVYIAGMTISSISGNVITGSATMNVLNGDVLVKGDYPTNGDTTMLTYCKNNVAPNYDGYQLHYKLATPEPITDDNCHIHGDIPKFDVGDNYLYLDSGGVLGEVGIPAPYIPNYYYLGNNEYGQSWYSPFKYKADSINAVYKNILYDNAWTLTSHNSNGTCRAVEPYASFDANATYTVDYKILATQAPQVGTISASYSLDIISTVNKLNEEMNNKQEHDSILDSIVDSSLYENLGANYIFSRSLVIGASDYRLYGWTPFLLKKVIPILTITLNSVTTWDGAGGSISIPLSDCNIKATIITTKGAMILLQYLGSNSTYRTYLANNGGSFTFQITADCRGRI